MSMDGETIKPWQAERLRDAIRPSLTYLRRLRARMEKTGFPIVDDALFLLVRKAEEDVHALFVE